MMGRLRSVSLRTLAAIVALCGIVMVVSVSPARADDPCEGPACEDDGDVVINPTDPGTPGDPGDGGEGGEGGTGSNAGSQTCLHQGEEVPCSSSAGIWSNAYGCYLQLAPGGGPPPPAASNPNGAWYTCTNPGCGLTCGGRTIWLDDSPEQLPSPAELAQDALERMDLEPIQIGIVPEDEPGRIGLVGMPVWMWVENPTPNTFGPITESATAGSLTVTATARVRSTIWNMGDGNAVTCTTDGTPYEDKFGESDSPDCGYRYTTTSWDKSGHEFTITAITHWVVDWTGGGQDGSIPIEHVTETRVRVGELQVLSQ